MNSNYSVTYRPWGYFVVISSTPTITVKIVSINPDSRLSLQYHDHRSEEWLCLRGIARAQIGEENFTLLPGDRKIVDKKVAHRLSSEKGGTVILEIAFTDEPFSEDDIVRLSDDYGRVGV